MWQKRLVTCTPNCQADIASASMDWNASRFRAESYKLLRNVRSIIQLDIPFYPEMAYELEGAS